MNNRHSHDPKSPMQGGASDSVTEPTHPGENVSSHSGHTDSIPGERSVLSDQELATRAADGEVAAWREIYDRNAQAVLAFISRMVPNPSTAEELTEETFLKVFHSIRRYNATDTLPTWIRRIALNVTRDRLRTSRYTTSWESHHVMHEPHGSYTAWAAGELAADPGLGVSAAEIILRGHYLEARRGFASDRALAAACRVSDGEVLRWRIGEATERSKDSTLRDLALVVSRLMEYYEPEVVPDWLYGNSPDLAGRRPVDLVREGRLAEVLAAMEAQASGAYL